jgi:hypothetical protein
VTEWVGTKIDEVWIPEIRRALDYGGAGQIKREGWMESNNESRGKKKKEKKGQECFKAE